MKFVKINNYWWEYENGTAYNTAGGHQYIHKDEVYEFCEAEGWDKLNWFGTDIYNNSSKIGWLSPDGIFYGCDYSSHGSQAIYVHHMSEGDLEKNGWIKLTFSHRGNIPVVYFYGEWEKGKVIPTKAQMDYLKNTECDLEDIKFMLRFGLGQRAINSNAGEVK